MRKGVSFILGVLGLAGCEATSPYMDLDQPIYLITEDGFFAGCEEENDTADCEKGRVREVRNGINDWFKHFAEPTRPQAVFVASQEDVPSDAENTPIHLQITSGLCSEDAVACYYYEYDSEPIMAFVFLEYVIPIMAAHEFGHALGRDHDDMPAGRKSVMTPKPSAYVVPLDIQILCELHDECPPHESTWCEGGFYDPCRCPSSSFEEGEAMREASEITCE